MCAFPHQVTGNALTILVNSLHEYDDNHETCDTYEYSCTKGYVRLLNKIRGKCSVITACYVHKRVMK